MKLTLNLSPVRSNELRRAVKWSHPILSIEDTIIPEGRIDSNSYDLSELPDGATATHPELGRVIRNGDDYELTIYFGHGLNAPHETRYPDPIVLVDHEGPIPLPPYDIEPEPEPEPAENEEPTE